MIRVSLMVMSIVGSILFDVMMLAAGAYTIAALILIIGFDFSVESLFKTWEYPTLAIALMLIGIFSENIRDFGHSLARKK